MCYIDCSELAKPNKEWSTEWFRHSGQRRWRRDCVGSVGPKKILISTSWTSSSQHRALLLWTLNIWMPLRRIIFYVQGRETLWFSRSVTWLGGANSKDRSFESVSLRQHLHQTRRGWCSRWSFICFASAIDFSFFLVARERPCKYKSMRCFWVSTWLRWRKISLHDDDLFVFVPVLPIFRGILEWSRCHAADVWHSNWDSCVPLQW